MSGPAEAHRLYPTTFMQAVFLRRIRAGGMLPRTGNLYVVWRLDGRIPRDRIGKALGALLHRYPALRARFTAVEPFEQWIAPIGDVEPRDLGRAADGWEKVARSFVREPFASPDAPLWRIGAISCDDGTIVVLSYSYLVADTPSRGILFEAFRRLLRETEDGAAGTPDMAFAEFARTQLSAFRNDAHVEGWRRYMAGARPVFSVDPSECGNPGYAEARADLNAVETERMLRCVRRSGATLPLVALALLGHGLAAHLDGDDILVRTPFSWRGDHAGRLSVGMFTGAMAYRVRAERSCFGRTLEAAREAYLTSFRLRDGFHRWDRSADAPATTPVQLIVTPSPRETSRTEDGVARLFLDEADAPQETRRAFVASVRHGRSGLRLRAYFRRDLPLRNGGNLCLDMRRTLLDWSGGGDGTSRSRCGGRVDGAKPP